MPHFSNIATLVLTAVIATGCASFNDTIIVDVGDQFRLLQTGMAESDANGQLVGAPAGFECEFHARTTNAGPFTNEREVNGTLRCRRIDIAEDVARVPAER